MNFVNRLCLTSLTVIAFSSFALDGCKETGASHMNDPTNTQPITTLDKTVIPVPVPSSSPSIFPFEIAKYSQYGYGVWQYGAGLACVKRVDLLPLSYSSATVSRSAQLLNFFAMSDIHITDEESPAQPIYFGYKGGNSSAYSAMILYTTQVLDAAVKTVNALHRYNPFDFGIFLGDAINNAQYNELRWYIDILDGKTIIPDSGIKDDPLPGPNNDYQDEFNAAGLDATIKWYQVLGNHDHFWMGASPVNEYIRQTYIGENILDMDDPFTNPRGINSRGIYNGSIDGRTQYGDIIGAGPVGDFTSPPKVLAADPDRHVVTRTGWMREFFSTSSYPVGHGFAQSNLSTGDASYSFEPNPAVPIKVIVLDDTQRDEDYAMLGHGYLTTDRFNWLVGELEKGQAEGKLMIIAAHIPISLIGLTSNSAVTANPLVEKLHTYPNLVLWIAGHRHRNVVTVRKSPDDNHPELGFWEVETASLKDFPQQFRTFSINRNSDSTVSIVATNVDTDISAPGFSSLSRSSVGFATVSPSRVEFTSLSRSYAVASNQIFKIPLDPPPSGAYNAELVKQLTPFMRAKLQKSGTTLTN